MVKREQAARQRPELQGLLAAAKLTPDDNLPRLVVADWLEEHGDEADRARAELVRLQIGLCPRVPLHTVESPTADEEELLGQHRGSWLRGLPPALDKFWRFERGMLRLDLPVKRAMARKASPARDCESLNWLERMVVRGGSASVIPGLLATTFMQHATQFALPWANLGADGTRDFVEHSRSHKLAGLDLNHNSIGDMGAEHLAHADHLADLHSLEIWVNNIGEAGAQALARSRMRSLRTLNLGGNHIGERGMAALAASPVLRPLETFLVWDNNIGPVGAEALAQAEMPALQRVYLNQNGLGPEGTVALLGWSALARIQVLSLWNNRIGSEAIEALVEVPMPELVCLRLSSNHLDDEAAIALARSPYMGQLQRLDLQSNQVGDTGARALLNSKQLVSLRQLNLLDNRLSPLLQGELAERFKDESESVG